MANNKYPFSAYDKHLSLNMSPALWAVIAFLARPYVVVVSSVVNRRDRMELINMIYTDRTGLMLAAVAAMPALLLAYVWIKRTPGAAPWIRWLWHRGRLLLASATLLNIPLLAAPLLTGAASATDTMIWLQICICGLILYYLWSSERVWDIFADFPAPETSGPKRR